MEKDRSKRQDRGPDSNRDGVGAANIDDFLIRKKVSLLLNEIREVRTMLERLSRENEDNKAQLRDMKELIEVYREKIKYLKEENIRLAEYKQRYSALEKELARKGKVIEEAESLKL